MKMKAWLFPMVLLLAGALLWAIWAVPTAGAAAKPIKIGVFLSYTGDIAYYGKKIESSLKVRLDEANWTIAGRPVELIIEDDGSFDTIKSVQAAKKLLDYDKCDVFIGPSSTPSYHAIVPLFNERKKLCLTPTWRGGLIPWKPGEENWVLTPGGALTQIAYPAGKWAFENKYKTVATIGADYASGHNAIGAFVDSFTKAGGKVVQQQWPPTNTLDLGAYLAKLQKADMTVACAFGPMILSLIKQYHEYGLWDKQRLLIIPNDTTDEKCLSDLGDFTAGMLVATPYTYLIDTPINKKFVAAYQKKWGEHPPADSGVQGYSTMNVAIAILEATRGDTTPEALRKVIAGLVVEGPAGTYRFTEFGYPTIDVHVAEAQKKDGKMVYNIIHTTRNVDFPGVYKKPK